MKIVADDKIPFLKGALEPFADIVYLPGKVIDNITLKDADALLVRTRTKCTGELLKETKVRFIGTATIGFDHIDTEYCNKNNIFWTNAPGCNSSSVQQYIASALVKLAHIKNIRLEEKTVGIIGVGNVGSKVEKIARAFGMHVLLNDPPRSRVEGENNFVGLRTILSESDIITLHVPLNNSGEDRTYHLFDDNTFKNMRKGAWLFNSSRGEVVETSSLKAALGSGKLGGAVIDVWENEPEIDPELLAKSFIATPHIAGYSTDGKANGTAMVVNSLSGYFGFPLKNWYPVNVPQPTFPVIIIDGKGKSDEAIIREAILHTYNVEEDDQRLRMNPSDFEKLRGDYSIRREFPAYIVKLADCPERVREILKKLGFKFEL